jgi:hypothetical protein
MALKPCLQCGLVALQSLVIEIENARVAARSAAFRDAGFPRRQRAGIGGYGRGRLRRFHPLYCSSPGSGWAG